MNSVLREIEVERYNQDKKWGSEHDDRRSHAVFVDLVITYANWSLQKIKGACNRDSEACLDSTAKARRRMIQVAALAVASVERLDRLVASGFYAPQKKAKK